MQTMWPRKRTADRAQPEHIAVDPSRPMSKPSPETQRALDAMRLAGAELKEARETRARIDRAADELDELNLQNGFRLMVERALGARE